MPDNSPQLDPNSTMTRQNTGQTRQAVLDLTTAVNTLALQLATQQTANMAAQQQEAQLLNQLLTLLTGTQPVGVMNWPNPLPVHVDNQPSFSAPSTVSIGNVPHVIVDNPTPGPLATQPISGTVGIGNWPANPTTSTLQADTITKLEAMRVLLAAASTSALQTSGNTTLASILSALQGPLRVSNTGDNYRPISGNGTVVVKNSTGVLQRILPATGITVGATITIYDNAVGNTTNRIYPAYTLASLGGAAAPLEFNLRFTNGLTVITSGLIAGEVLVIYS